MKHLPAKACAAADHIMEWIAALRIGNYRGIELGGDPLSAIWLEYARLRSQFIAYPVVRSQRLGVGAAAEYRRKLCFVWRPAWLAARLRQFRATLHQYREEGLELHILQADITGQAAQQLQRRFILDFLDAMTEHRIRWQTRERNAFAGLEAYALQERRDAVAAVMRDVPTREPGDLLRDGPETRGQIGNARQMREGHVPQPAIPTEY